MCVLSGERRIRGLCESVFESDRADHRDTGPLRKHETSDILSRLWLLGQAAIWHRAGANSADLWALVGGIPYGLITPGCNNVTSKAMTL